MTTLKRGSCEDSKVGDGLRAFPGAMLRNLNVGEVPGLTVGEVALSVKQLLPMSKSSKSCKSGRSSSDGMLIMSPLVYGAVSAEEFGEPGVLFAAGGATGIELLFRT